MVQYVYTLGAAGERRKVTELDRTVEYTYDSLYLLTRNGIIISGEKPPYYIHPCEEAFRKNEIICPGGFRETYPKEA